MLLLISSGSLFTNEQRFAQLLPWLAASPGILISTYIPEAELSPKASPTESSMDEVAKATTLQAPLAHSLLVYWCCC